MTAWLRLVCAVMLGLGLSLAGATAASATTTRPAVAHLERAVPDVSPASGWAGHVFRHGLAKHATPVVPAAVAALATVVAALIAVALVRPHRPRGAGRRTSSGGARAPPVAVGY
jgi:hypothetical protein